MDLDSLAVWPHVIRIILQRQGVKSKTTRTACCDVRLSSCLLNIASAGSSGRRGGWRRSLSAWILFTILTHSEEASSNMPEERQKCERESQEKKGKIKENEGWDRQLVYCCKGVSWKRCLKALSGLQQCNSDLRSSTIWHTSRLWMHGRLEEPLHFSPAPLLYLYTYFSP